MTLWFVFALMTAAAIFAVLWPLGRRGRSQNDASEATVYKDQLSEIDRDLAAGLIAAPEAEAARVEIGRRLLAAADDQRGLPVAASVRWRRTAALIALIGLPIVSVALAVERLNPDAILLSSDAWEEPMWQRCADFRAAGIQVIPVYKTYPESAPVKKSVAQALRCRYWSRRAPR